MRFLGSLFAAAAITASAAAQSSYSIQWDDFRSGFSVNTASSKWFHFAAGPFVGNDGVEITTKQGIRVAPAASNPATGAPAFTLTLGQETDPVNNPFALPGGIDHVKWLVYANHISSAGFPGFDCIPGQELSFECWMSGRSYGNEFHPFGAAVADPHDDIRLACAAMPTIDFETFLVADFFLTNKRIYAVYERLPFARTPQNNYAAFTYAVPLAERQPHQQHHLTIAYNRTANTIRWLIDGIEVFRVDQPGRHLPTREHLILDHGGVEEDVSCRQRNTGLGMFTLLDAAYPGQQGLVQLSVEPGFYYSTASGAPMPQTFLDPQSTTNNRIWGQGAEICVRKARISSR